MEQAGEKPKLAVYWAASCGGCEVALLNMHEHFFALVEQCDLVYCPCLVDSKTSYIEALPDGALAVTLFNGALRSSENLAMARLLRRKSRLLVAFGSCAIEGCIPALSNFSSAAAHLHTIYQHNPTVDNPTGIIPLQQSSAAGQTLALPEFLDQVYTLADVVTVDCAIPGCPPEAAQLWPLLGGLVTGDVPPAGALCGCGTLTVCAECDRSKLDTPLAALHRNHEMIPERQRCLLEQGLLCMGIVTRSGCGAPCTQANMPCSGCYGAPDGVADQGGAMIAALGSVLELPAGSAVSAQERADTLDKVLDAIPDYAGQFYKYGLAGSILKGKGGDTGEPH